MQPVRSHSRSRRSLPCRPPRSRQPARGPGLDDLGQQPDPSVARDDIAADEQDGSGLRLAWTRDLGGVGNAQPLYLRGISIGGNARDIYIAAGERGRVVAYDALTGELLWKRELGALDTGCSEMPDGVFGVTGTPVYDPAGGFVYVAATDKLWAFDVRTGTPARLAGQAPDRRRARARLGSAHARQRPRLSRHGLVLRPPAVQRGGCSRWRRARERSTTRGSP